MPPPLPNAGLARKTYLAGAIFLLPALTAWLFSTIFLLPRLELIWQQTGLVHSRAGWLLDASRLLKDNFYWALIALIAVFAALEYRVRAWPRYRWWVVATTVFLLNVAALVGLTLLCISALLAVPLVTAHH